jgi:hypothetical protein
MSADEKCEVFMYNMTFCKFVEYCLLSLVISYIRVRATLPDDIFEKPDPDSLRMEVRPIKVDQRIDIKLDMTKKFTAPPLPTVADSAAAKLGNAGKSNDVNTPIEHSDSARASEFAEILFNLFDAPLQKKRQ